MNNNIVSYIPMVGVPAKQIAWMSEYGEQLALPVTGNAQAVCSHTGTVYQLTGNVLTRLAD